tara:strand:+ start:3954 stop:4796 length:843 start_codon:yes stop_codon:yes gene_type:complete
MTFFNKKEEVLDVQLTSEGRRQLSMGKLKPTYYAFYDDDVLYDVAWADSSEEQNDSQPRILDNTAYPKLNSRFKGAKEEGKDNYNKNNKKNTENLEYNIYLKESPYLTPLGTYDSLKQAAPYFKVTLLTENVNNLSTADAQVIAGAAMKIPQINFTSSYKYYYIQDTDEVYYREDPMLLEIIEKNTQFSDFDDNFEIEVYEITGSSLSQPKLFLEENTSPKTPQEQIEYQLKVEKMEDDLQNLLGETLEVLLDEQTEPLFPPELITKRKAKPKIICDDEK